MNTRLAAFLTPALALAAAALGAPEAGHADGAAHAGEHAVPKAGVLPEVNQGIIPMIVSILVFVVVFAVLAVKVWPPIVKSLNEREAKIRSEIESAEMARQQAKAALDQYERALADARAQGQRELEKAKALQAQQLSEMRAKADADLAQAKDKAMREIDAAKKIAIQEVYAQGAALSTMVAGRILKRELNASDQQRFVDEALANLGASNN